MSVAAVAKIKVAELFYSIQGEGLHVGVPSVFLRTFGCNFTCSGFGMPRGERSNERNLIHVALYSKYEELPLVHTGCDSYASWDPRFKHLSPMMSTSDIAANIRSMLPSGNFSNSPTPGTDTHLIITGGEPLLGWQRSYPDLLDEFPELLNLTFETNGTQKLSPELTNYLNERSFLHVTWSVSAKLSGSSGEAIEEALQPAVVEQYLNVQNSSLYFKFVCSSERDVEEALVYRQLYTNQFGFEPMVYIMPAGGTSEHYFMNAKKVAELALQLGLRYSPRIQVDVFKNAWGT